VSQASGSLSLSTAKHGHSSVSHHDSGTHAYQMRGPHDRDPRAETLSPIECAEPKSVEDGEFTVKLY